MTISFDVKTNLKPERFKKIVTQLAAQNLSIIFNRNIGRLQRIAQQEVRIALENGDELNSIIDGVLRGELGLTDPEQKLNAINQRIIASTKVSFTKPAVSNNKFVANMRIFLAQTNYSDLLSLPAAYQDRTSSDGGRVNGPPLEWLRWLLLEGGARIILDYEVVVGERTGRSGLQYVMRQSRGQSWSVPGQFQGSAEDNFITRAIDSRLSIIEQRVFKFIKRVFGR
jgi:hypothetical protein